jgi:hypothetical protein
MANPAPCQACLETPDAEFCVTNRAGVPWPFEQAVVNLCVPCLIDLGITMGTALQQAIAAMELDATPGALEQVEADEGVVRIPAAKAKRRPRKKAAAPVQVIDPEVPEEAQAAHDEQ